MNGLGPIQRLLDPDWDTGYSEIMHQFKTGDIILVHARYKNSWMIEFLQGSHWTHTAMVVLAKDIDPAGTLSLPEVMLWESNILMECDAINVWGDNDGLKQGPMLVDLKKRLDFSRQYDDVKMAYKPIHLEHNLPVELLPDFFDSMIDKNFPSDIEILASAYAGRVNNEAAEFASKFIDVDIDYINKRYQIYPMENLIDKAAFSDKDVDRDEIYCSELIALTYKKLGLLTDHFVSNAYVPKDFSDQGTIRFLNRTWLAPEMLIEMNR